MTSFLTAHRASKRTPLVRPLWIALVFVQIATPSHAQLEVGSDGSDGALNVTSARVIDMRDHPDGIYRYSAVNVAAPVTFIPNARNTPVVWLVQGDVTITIAGTIDITGKAAVGTGPGASGPGGFPGGPANLTHGNGQGPGGGLSVNGNGGNASYGSLGQRLSPSYSSLAPGPTYGNSYVFPLIGGSGGGGSVNLRRGGGGGGGAILIAANGIVTINGTIAADGAYGWDDNGSPRSWGGYGSGGAVRIIARKIAGTGQIDAYTFSGGDGRIRFDTYENSFGGGIGGQFTQGSHFVLLPDSGGVELKILSVGGSLISPSPSAKLATPDAIIGALQNNPVPVVVQCLNLPLNSSITVSVKPINGLPVSAVGLNTSGTSEASTATVMLTIPRGGGLIYASAQTSN